jgi:mannose-1-phosphate guanylyltransferase/mannose-6-phosphate isomerase
MNKNLYAVILAGGSGTRFWPVSRKLNPKQFLDITGQGTLFQETLARVQPNISGANVFVVTNAAYRKAIEKQIVRFKVPKKNVLLEPEGRNTAPAICWAAAKVHSVNPDAVMAVLPSDHLIQNHKKFLDILEEAVGLAGQGFLVTLGIVPTRPETGYGYLKTSTMKVDGKTIVKVARFTEKPDLSTAKRFIKRKNYFWNSGMFVWKTAVILDAFRQYLPEVYRRLAAAERGPVSTGQAYIDKVWGDLPNISIDYGILEKADNVAAVPAPGIDWSDLGSWESLAEVLDKDKHGNIFKGDVIPVECHNTLVWGNKKVIAPIGLSDIVIVDTPDALLVCRKDMSQHVKDVVSALNKNNRAES